MSTTQSLNIGARQLAEKCRTLAQLHHLRLTTWFGVGIIHQRNWRKLKYAYSGNFGRQHHIKLAMLACAITIEMTQFFRLLLPPDDTHKRPRQNHQHNAAEADIIMPANLSFMPKTMQKPPSPSSSPQANLYKFDCCSSHIQRRLWKE